MKLIKYTAEWCGPCRSMKPVVKRFLEKHPEVKYEEVDIEKHPGKARSIKALPTFVFRGGKAARAYGSMSLGELEKLFQKAKSGGTS